MAVFSMPDRPTRAETVSNCEKPSRIRVFSRCVSLKFHGHQQPTKENSNEHESFIFCSDSCSVSSRSIKSDISTLLGNIAIAGGSSLLMGTNPVIPIAVSCIPFVVPMSLGRLSDTGMFTFLSEDAKNFVKGITYVSMGQGTLAMCDFVFGDLLAGFMKGIFAAMGMYITFAEDGASILPSFTVVSFVNGSITLLSAFERMSARATPMFAGAMPLYLNYLHLSQIAHPLLCFAGAYMGWQIVKELRRSGAIGAAVMTVDPLLPGGISRNNPGHVLNPSSNGSGYIPPSGSGFTPFTGRGHSLSGNLTEGSIASGAAIEQPPLPTTVASN